MPDYSAGRAKNDLGFVMFDLQSDILYVLDITGIFLYRNNPTLALIHC